MFYSIRIQATLLALVLAVVPIVIVGGIITQRSFNSLEGEAVNAQKQESEIAAEKIVAFLNERENQLRWASEVRGLATLSTDEQQALLNAMLSSELTYRELTLLDQDGAELMRLSRREIYLLEDLGNRRDSLEFSQAILGNTYVSDIQIDEAIREPFITIGFPVRNPRDGDVNFVLVAELRFRPVWDLIAAFQTGQKSDTYVTDSKGLLVAHANPSTVLNERTYKLPPQNGRTSGLFGEDVIQAQTPLQFNNLKLVVVSERLTDDALQLASDNLRTSIITTIAVLIVAGFVAVYFVGRFVRPILRLSKVAQEISNGNLAAEAHIGGKNELSLLAKSFNDMTTRLRELIHSLEARVEERTADLRTAKQETEAALEKAIEADKLKSQFLASMSHELRTPLNSILTFTELLEMGTFGEVSEEQKDYLRKILFSGRHLLGLINDVLDITKIQSGMLKLFIEKDFDIHKESLFIVSSAEKTLQDKPVQIITDIDPEFLPLTCDKRRIRQVLLNLMSNAVKFTEQGTITLSAKQREDEVLFAVIDTGPGIRPEQQEMIFEPFVQTETGIQHAGGTGLGLPISKKLVEAHGGRLWLESTVGEGAAFFVVLPLQPKTEMMELEQA